MEKFLELVNKVWEYLLANPVILYVCAGVLAAILITVIALCIKKGVAKKKAKKAAKVAAAAKAAKQAKVAEETKIAEKAKATEEAKAASRARAEEIAREIEEAEKEEKAKAAKEAKAEPAKKTEPKKKAEPKAKKQAPAPVEEEQKAEEPVQEVVVKAEEPKAEEPAKKPAAKKTTAKKPAEKKPVEKKAEPATAEKAVEEKSEPAKAEVSKAKPAKRYSGKWTISRLFVLEKAGGEPVEETYFFELHASNGEKLLSSEEYTTLAGAMKGIETHKANIARDNFRITTTKKGEYIFKLMSGKNTLLCTGENYQSKVRCESAIESTKRFSETAYIGDAIKDVYVTIPVDDEEEIEEIPDNGYVGKWIIGSKKLSDIEEVFYFELFASNGEKLLTSEDYTSYVGAVNGIHTHKANIEKDNFRIALTKRGDYIFKLLSGNGQLLCLGEHYKTKRRCESAVESVKRFAKNAAIFTDSTIAEEK